MTNTRHNTTKGEPMNIREDILAAIQSQDRLQEYASAADAEEHLADRITARLSYLVVQEEFVSEKALDICASAICTHGDGGACDICKDDADKVLTAQFHYFLNSSEGK